MSDSNVYVEARREWNGSGLAQFLLCAHRHKRKNHYGSRSRRGTEVAALFYSLIESAKLSGLDETRYLAEATRRGIDNPGTAALPRDLLQPKEIVQLLPIDLESPASCVEHGFERFDREAREIPCF